MSSLVLETYEQGNVYAECYWDKYAPHYNVRVAKRYEGSDIYGTLWTNCYGKVEQAKNSFKRQVRKIKKGEH